MPNEPTEARVDQRTFVDTNVLVYAHDGTDPAKQVRARTALERLWASGTGMLSTQVLQEFHVVATRRLRPPMPSASAREIIGLYSTWDVVLIEPAIILGASHLSERHQLSFWDALMVEAARVGGAERILSEDLQDGQVIEGVTIEDPFRVHGPGARGQ